jgi:hypothetical protein
MKAALVVAALASVVGAASVEASSRATCLPGRQAAVLVHYEGAGGFAGMHDELTVRRSGRATVSRLRPRGTATFVLTCARLRTLRTLLVNARFGTLDPVYAPDSPYADGLVETISHGGGTVRVLTGAEPPRRLERVLQILRAVVAARR